MKKLKFNAVHTRKKHSQCESCVYYIQAKYFTVGGEYIFEFCTSKGHKGVIIQYRERTDRSCFDFLASEKPPESTFAPEENTDLPAIR
ncbi:MAG: hypothetical protein M1609_02995 [Firmicutes bacterium]|nr:hypothetical protein [Bacillota bacterium]